MKKREKNKPNEENERKEQKLEKMKQKGENVMKHSKVQQNEMKCQKDEQ